MAIDYAQALAAYKVGAEEGDAFSQHNLGYMYHRGNGVTPSWRRAREYCKRASQLGNSKARRNMDAMICDIQKVIVSPKVHVYHSIVHSFVTARSTPP